jgi:tRNA A-37 threonylcarbamoyl transferase component Bud32
MAVCHECDSQVADNDIFCPFCGISLQPTASVPDAPAADEPVADDLDSTIMMTPAEAAELAASATKEEAVQELGEAKEDIPIEWETDASADETPVDFVEASENAKESELIEQPENSDYPPGIENPQVPTPAILSESNDTNDNIAYRETGEYEKDDSGQIVEPDLDPVLESANVVDEFPGDLTLISAPLSSDLLSEDEPTLEEELPADVPNDHPIGTDSAENRMIQIPTDSSGLEDPYPSKSMFDSVRIIEGRPPFSQEDVATRVPNFGSAPLGVESVERTPPPAEPKPQAVPSTGFNDTDGRKSSKLKPLTEGTVLNNRYEIIRKIGGGGMGAVYLAGDNNLGGVLRAVKEMVQAHIEDEQQDKAINDFRRESMILSTLDHPSIPTIFDYFYDEEESRFYLVMKYISGGDLASRLRAAPEGKIEEKTVAEWGLQVTEVLEYLHNQPTTIVYRDLKPSNIMIDGNSGRVMLVDFGIARSISQKEEKGVTAVGTMGYAPPELFSGNVEPRSDIYSLGSTMFHLMTGADPQSNPLLIFDFQKNPRPRQINPRLSDQMELLLMKAVEYSADLRFRDAAELRAALNAHLDDIRSGNLTYGAGQAPVSVSLSNQQVFCGFCGQRIVATDLFCAFCGAKQPIAQQGVHSEIYSSASAATAKLLIEGTSELAAPAFTLQKDENLVGRRDPMSNIFPEVDLSKYDPQTKISRRHARIWRDGQTFLLEDLGSSNGTILTSKVKDSFRLIPHKPQALGNGDKIKIGDTVLHFIVN